MGAGVTDYYQTIHEKPSLGGFVGRASSADFSSGSLETDAGVGYLARAGPELLPMDLNSEEVRRVFGQLRIKYVVLHRFTPKGVQIISEGIFDQYDLYLRTVAGLEQIFADDILIVYRNSDIQ